MYSEQTFRYRYTLCAEVWVWVDGFTGEQLVSVTQINLASALSLATTISEEDMALDQVPVRYDLVQPEPAAGSSLEDVPRPSGRLQHSLAFFHRDDKDTQAVGRRHDYHAHLGGIGHQVPHLVIRAIGHGAYVVSIATVDQTTGNAVVIKTIPKTSDDLVDAKRIVGEICLMRHLGPHIVQGLDYMRPPAIGKFEDTYIVTDLMETDLHRVIQWREHLDAQRIAYITY
ncbi:unnamed protein product [Aphanomyces euteiches]